MLMAQLAALGVALAFPDFFAFLFPTKAGSGCSRGSNVGGFPFNKHGVPGDGFGPQFWNLFFQDIVLSVPDGEQGADLFVDDLSIDSSCDAHVSRATLVSGLQEAQRRTHAWGQDNRVSFDPGKEHIKVLHPDVGDDDQFRFLGTLIDCRLTMKPCIDQVMNKIRPKIKALLRTRWSYSIVRMLNQFRTHIWCHIEYSQGALLLAQPAQLQRLDDAQTRFLDQLGLTDTEAFVRYNFAPPALRRAVGILGFLHNRVLGLAHPGVNEMFPLCGARPPWHNKQLESYYNSVCSHPRLYPRSVFHYVLIYNRLPQWIIDEKNVKTFQQAMNAIAKCKAEVGEEGWRKSFQSCQDVVNTFY